MTIMCGGCKATGIKMVWNSGGALVPAEPREPCPTCNGSGWFPSEQNAAGWAYRRPRDNRQKPDDR